MRLSFKIFNIPVMIGLDFLLCVSILAYQRLTEPLYFISWLVTVFVSILIHELGHAFAFRRFGCTPWIRLHGFGGQTGISEGQSVKPWQDLVVSLAGPAAGLLTGALFFLIRPLFPVSDMSKLIFSDILKVNIVWSLVNLLPLFPLDGGHVARVAITHVFKEKGEKFFYVFSMAVAVILAGLCLYKQEYWLAILPGFLFFNNLQILRQLSVTGPDRALSEELKRVYALLEAKNFEEAHALSEELYAKAVTPTVKGHIQNLGSWALYKLGNYGDALQKLETIADPRLRDGFLYGVLLHMNGRYREAHEPLLRVFTARLDNDSCEMLFRNLEKLDDPDNLYKIVRGNPGAKITDQLYAAIAGFLYEKGKFFESSEIGSIRYSMHRNPDAAYGIARSRNRMGDRKSALRWLDTAIKAGFSDYRRMANEPDLADLAQDPAFASLLETLAKKNI